MKVRYRALALPAVVLGISLSGGCGEANEEKNVDTKTAPIDPANPPKTYKSYGEKIQHQAELDAKNKQAGKGKAAKPATPVTPPETKTPAEEPK